MNMEYNNGKAYKKLGNIEMADKLFDKMLETGKEIIDKNKDSDTGVNQSLSNELQIIFEKEGQKIKANIFKSGKYDLEWSDEKKSELNVRPFSVDRQISSPWKVNFSKELAGLPLKTPKPFIANELKSLTQYDDEDIKYYSGTIQYFDTFEMGKVKGYKVYLVFGNVQEIAYIYISNKKVGTSWIAPFRMEITNFLKEGKNHLQVDVVNLWANRLIGDGKKPKNERSTFTNVTKFDSADSEQYLRVSGLLGPVNIIYSKQVVLR